MKRFSSVLFLIGTLSCSALASDSKMEQFDREELRQALERFVRDTPGFVPDLRSTAAPLVEQVRRNKQSEQLQSQAATGPVRERERSPQSNAGE